MCDSKDLLIGFLYGELDAADRRTFQAHLTSCADCREELAGLRATRGQIASWTPPEPDFGFRIVRGAAAPPPAPRFRISPAWGLAAAAVLVMGVAAGIANLDVSYGGLVVRTGWNRGGDVATARGSRRTGCRAGRLERPGRRARSAAARARDHDARTGAGAHGERARTSRSRGAAARARDARSERNAPAAGVRAAPQPDPRIRDAAEAGPRGDRSGHGAPSECERRRGQAIPRDRSSAWPLRRINRSSWRTR